MFCCLCLMFSTLIHMLFLLYENIVQACVFHVEFSVARDMTVDFCCICPNFSTCTHMLFLLCGNNVQVCTFHVEYYVTRELTVGFLLFYVETFLHASTCYSCCEKIMIKHVYFMLNVMLHRI